MIEWEEVRQPVTDAGRFRELAIQKVATARRRKLVRWMGSKNAFLRAVVVEQVI